MLRNIFGVLLAYNALTVFFGGWRGALFSVYCLSTSHSPLEAFSEISSEPSDGFSQYPACSSWEFFQNTFSKYKFINSK